nr:MAG TPA: brinker DNA-binding domain protein [Caudoviricetes sp.]
MKVNISRNTVTRWRDVDYTGGDTITCKDILCFGYDKCDNCLFETNAAKVRGLQRLGRLIQDGVEEP